MSASSHRSLLLDTNIVIAVFGGYHGLKWQIAYDAQYLIPCIVVGELLYGAHFSSEVRGNIREIEAFVDAMEVIGCDRATAAQFGITKSELRRAGNLIPDNDIWIASIAIQNRLTLISRDAHFEAVPGLRLQTW